jgi:hypothetical protein
MSRLECYAVRDQTVFLTLKSADLSMGNKQASFICDLRFTLLLVYVSVCDLFIMRYLCRNRVEMCDFE